MHIRFHSSQGGDIGIDGPSQHGPGDGDGDKDGDDDNDDYGGATTCPYNGSAAADVSGGDG